MTCSRSSSSGQKRKIPEVWRQSLQLQSKILFPMRQAAAWPGSSLCVSGAAMGRQSIARIFSDHLRAVADRHASVQMLMNNDRLPRQRVSVQRVFSSCRTRLPITTVLSC